MKDLNQRMARGAAWMVLLKFLERGIGLISTLILARLLLPEDFGLLMLATAITAILEVLGSFSFDLALIQNQKTTRTHFDSAWTLNVLYGVLSTLVLFAIARPAADFFEEPRLLAVVLALAPGAVIAGLSNIGIVAFRKELDFQLEFRFLLLRRLCALVITVGCALIFRNYWALVAGTLGSRALGVVISYRMHPYRPRFTLAAARELMSFSSWMLFSNVLLFVNNRGSDFVVGKVIGAEALGVYNVAYEISNLPTTELVFPISRVVFPGYAKLADDRVALGTSFLNVLGFVALFALPIGVGIMMLASELVSVFLGSRWLEAVVPIQLLALYGVLRALQSNTGSVYMALGKPHQITWLTLLFTCIAIPFSVVGAHLQGTHGVAAGMLTAIVLHGPINFYTVLTSLCLKWKPFVALLTGPLIGSVVMAFALSMLKDGMGGLWPGHAGATLLICVPAGIMVYFTSIYLLWYVRGQGAERSEAQLLQAVLGRLRRSPA